MTDQVAFMAHHSKDCTDTLPGFVTLAQGSFERLCIQATVFLPRFLPSTSKATLGRLHQAGGEVIADAETERLELPLGKRGVGERHLEYLKETNPISNRKGLVSNCLRAQVEAGADILVSPALLHGGSPSTKNYRATLRLAEGPRTTTSWRKGAISFTGSRSLRTSWRTRIFGVTFSTP